MNKTSLEDLERNYDRPDPWGYKNNTADIERKRIILDRIAKLGPLESALDIGCGEGWITTDIPAKKIYGYEVSKQAWERKPKNVLPWNRDGEPNSRFDLVMATGVMYENYDWRGIVSLMNRHAFKYILTSNIADRELPDAIEWISGELIHLEEFPYHRFPHEQFTQRLRIYRR